MAQLVRDSANAPRMSVLAATTTHDVPLIDDTDHSNGFNSPSMVGINSVIVG